MLSARNISCHLRYLLVSFTLLWALMLNGHEVVAYTYQAPKAQDAQLASFPKNDKRTVVKQKVSLEATTSFVALNLQQAIEPLPQPTFATPTDDCLPAAHVAAASGAGFAAQLFPTTIQPNAP